MNKGIVVIVTNLSGGSKRELFVAMLSTQWASRKNSLRSGGKRATYVSRLHSHRGEHRRPPGPLHWFMLFFVLSLPQICQLRTERESMSLVGSTGYPTEGLGGQRPCWVCLETISASHPLSPQSVKIDQSGGWEPYWWNPIIQVECGFPLGARNAHNSR